MSEFIAEDEDTYFRIAVELGKNPDRVKNIKSKLSQDRLSASFFDIKSYTQSLEKAVEYIVANHEFGYPPRDLNV